MPTDLKPEDIYFGSKIIIQFVPDTIIMITIVIFVILGFGAIVI